MHDLNDWKDSNVLSWQFYRTIQSHLFVFTLLFTFVVTKYTTMTILANTHMRYVWGMHKVIIQLGLVRDGLCSGSH